MACRAADPRVAGIISMANDVLNSHAQIAHHRAVAGEISTSSGVFEETIESADLPRGRCLLALIDPFSYRERLVEPKLVVLGTNDDYTPTDALNLYWDDLPGPRSVLYLPNTNHVGSYYHAAVNPTAFAFVRAVAAGRTLPGLSLDLDPRAGELALRVTAGPSARSASVWTATSVNQEFRTSRWSQSVMRSIQPMIAGTAAFAGELPLPTSGFAAIFAEVEFHDGGAAFTLTTPMQVLGRAGVPVSYRSY
jgi:PhoPQ-activated pathogenicity-related protein